MNISKRELEGCENIQILLFDKDRKDKFISSRKKQLNIEKIGRREIIMSSQRRKYSKKVLVLGVKIDGTRKVVTLGSLISLHNETSASVKIVFPKSKRKLFLPNNSSKDIPILDVNEKLCFQL